jgi:hypothetical protein
MEPYSAEGWHHSQEIPLHHRNFPRADLVRNPDIGCGGELSRPVEVLGTQHVLHLFKRVQTWVFCNENAFALTFVEHGHHLRVVEG